MGVILKKYVTRIFATIILLLLSTTPCLLSRPYHRPKRHSKTNHGSSKERSNLLTVPASFINGLPKGICSFNSTPKITHEVEVLHKYAIVSSSRYTSSYPCGSKMRVSCVEPFEDLGGPTNLCRSKKVFTVVVVASYPNEKDEELDDGLVYLSSEVYTKLADPEHGFIRVALHPTK